MAGAAPVGFEEKVIRRFLDISILGMLASGYGALLLSQGLGGGILDAPTAALAGLALLLRAAIVTGWLRLSIPNSWVTAATLVYMGFYPLDYLFITRDFLRATVHLVFFVASVKVLTAARPRDYFFLKIIAFLELLAASIISSSLSFFVFLVIFVLSAIATFASTEILKASEGRRLVTRVALGFGRRLAWLTGYSMAAILLVTLALFFVLPRTARAALEHLLPPTQRVSGFASEVTLGQVGEIRRQGSAVMHVQFGDSQPVPGLKWRGAALSEFNGWKWFNSNNGGSALRPERGLLKVASDDALRQPAKRFSYRVLLHNTGSDWLFVAGSPEYLRVPWNTLVESPNGGYRVPFAETDGFTYTVHAALRHTTIPPARLTLEQRNFHLRLPPLDPRVLALSAELTKGLKTDFERATAIEHHLRAAYRYSLKPLDHEVDDPLAYFLLQSKQGHCEYFASAMAVLLRAAWIPSRVATGFQSGAFNPLSGWSVVRASDAHSWVEAWMPGEGWVTFDPTPPDPNAAPGAVSSKLALWSDAIEMFWQEWVIGYDIDRQLTLAFQVEQSRRRINFDWLSQAWNRAAGLVRGLPQATSAHNLAAALALVFLIPLSIWLWPRLREHLNAIAWRRRIRRGQAHAEDSTLVYRRMLAALKKRGIEKSASQTPAEFAACLSSELAAPVVREFTTVYHLFRYGGRQEEAARLAALLDKIEQLP
jgi:transglutaminase-like putative cysteine protease